MGRKKKEKQEEYKGCFFVWCLHDHSKENLQSYETKKYHEDCYHASQDYDMVRDLWNENFTIETDTFSKLAQVFSRLLKKGYSSDYLLFCVKYGIAQKILNYPPGLNYLVKDEKIKNAYAKKQLNEKAREIKKLQKEEMEEKMKKEESVKFEFKPKKNNFLDIFGGK